MTRRPRVGGGRGMRGAQGGGPGAPVSPTLYGLQAFTTADYYESINNPGGIEGAATGFWMAALFRVDSQAVSSVTRTIINRANNTTTSGWVLLTTATNSALTFYTVDGSAAARASPAYTITAGDVGKLMLAVGVREPSTLRLYVNRAQVGSGLPAGTGFTPAPERMYMGRRVQGNPATSATLFGVCGGLGVPTLAEIQAQADAVKLTGDIVAIPSKTGSLWSVKQDQLGAPPAVLDDKVGAEDMQRQGAPLLVTEPAPVWGW